MLLGLRERLPQRGARVGSARAARTFVPSPAPFIVAPGARAAAGPVSVAYVAYDGGTVVNQQQPFVAKNRRWPSQAEVITQVVAPTSLRWTAPPATLPPIRTSRLLVGLPLNRATVPKAAPKVLTGTGDFSVTVTVSVAAVASVGIMVGVGVY